MRDNIAGDFRLDDWLVQPALCRLSKDGRTVKVRAKVMDLLSYLAARPGEVVPKDRLLDDVWGSLDVSESALTRTVTELRQALGDDADQPCLLETIAKRGYRLIGLVERLDATAPASTVGASAPLVAASLDSPAAVLTTTIEPDPPALSTGQSSAEAPIERRKARVSGRPARATPLAAAVAGAVLVAGALAVWRVSIPPPEARVTRLELNVPIGARDDSFALSPDGRHVAFIAPRADGEQLLWVRSLADPLARLLPGTEGVRATDQPFWSPDGASLVFSAGNKLKRIDLPSGQPVTLADMTGRLLGGAWAPDGTLLLGTQRTSGTHGIHTLPSSGGTLVPWLPLRPGALVHGGPRLLPDGKRFLYVSWGAEEERREICLASLAEPGVSRCLGIEAHFFGGFTSDGYLAYARRGTLFAHPFDLDALRPRGEPIVVAEQIAQGPFGHTTLSLADGRALLYQARASDVVRFVWVDRAGRESATVGEPGRYGAFDVSSDGRFVVAERTDANATGLWLIDGTRGVTTNVVTRAVARGRTPRDPYGLVSSPVFSADGSHVFHQANRDGAAEIVAQPIRGGDERVVYRYEGGGVLYLADVSDDGQWLVIGISEPGRRDAAVVPSTGGDPQVFAEGSGPLGQARVSPDGRWVAFSAGQSGRHEVYVSPLPSTGERWQVSVAGGEQPAWREDARELFYLAPDGRVMVTAIAGGQGFDHGVARPLFAAGGAMSRFHATQYRASADGQRFLLNARQEHVATKTLQFVLNWTSALTR